MNPSTPPSTVKVWDPFVRIFHWSLVFCFVANLLNEDGNALHETLGYVAAGLVGARIVWGFIGSRHARFSDWVPRRQALVAYVQAMRAGHPPRFVGHNPAAAVMMLTLMAMILALGLTGWALGTDTGFGEEWLEELHEGLAYTTLAMVGLHVAAAVIESVRHRENLIRAMITGRKRPAGSPDDGPVP